MSSEKITLKKELFKDRDYYNDILLSGMMYNQLSEDFIKLYNEFVDKLNKYIDICEKRGKRY